MNISMTKCIRELNRNRNVEEMLTEYVKQCRNYYGSHACYKLALKYFMFFEYVSEETGPLSGDEERIWGQINGIIENFFLEMPDTEGCKKLAEELLSTRKEIADMMQVVSAYIDCFSVYEYILNRIEYRFKDMGDMPEDVKFTEDVVQYIFSSKDNAAINEKVRFVTGQLPMRMLRSKYFDVIRESVSIYKGSSLSSLEGFEYMFRTNAMLYKDQNMDIYFTGFKKPLEELGNASFEDIGQEQYKKYDGIIKDNTNKLLNLSDLYMLFGEIVNLLYTVIAVAAYTKEEDRMQDKSLGVVGLDGQGNVVVADEMLTPDSSRFWPAEGYQPGRPQPSFDKQYARDWLKAHPDHNWTLPQEVVDRTRKIYLQGYELLTGEKL